MQPASRTGRPAKSITYLRNSRPPRSAGAIALIGMPSHQHEKTAITSRSNGIDYRSESAPGHVTSEFRKRPAILVNPSYFTPTTMDCSAVRGSMRMSRKPTSCIQPLQSAPVKSKPPLNASLNQCCADAHLCAMRQPGRPRKGSAAASRWWWRPRCRFAPRPPASRQPQAVTYCEIGFSLSQDRETLTVMTNSAVIPERAEKITERYRAHLSEILTDVGQI